MTPRRDIEIFGVSFLDLICCGLGGVIVLALIFSAIIESAGEVEKAAAADSQEDAAGEKEPFLFTLQVDVLPTSARRAGPPLLSLGLANVAPSVGTYTVQAVSGPKFQEATPDDKITAVERHLMIFRGAAKGKRDLVFELSGPDGSTPTCVETCCVSMISDMAVEIARAPCCEMRHVPIQRRGNTYSLFPGPFPEVERCAGG